MSLLYGKIRSAQIPAEKISKSCRRKNVPEFIDNPNHRAYTLNPLRPAIALCVPGRTPPWVVGGVRILRV